MSEQVQIGCVADETVLFDNGTMAVTKQFRAADRGETSCRYMLGSGE